MDLSKMFTKPSGLLGKIALMNMNAGHKNVCEWALNQIKLENYTRIIDIGCGGGATIKRITDRTKNTIVSGIDHSYEAVEKSIKKNKDLIDNRVDIKQASVENIPYPDNEFDMAIAIETIYFWPNIIDSLKEVSRILKKGADFFIVCEAHDKDNPWQNRIQGMTMYDENDYERILSESEFIDINFNISKNWILVSCKKA